MTPKFEFYVMFLTGHIFDEIVTSGNLLLIISQSFKNAITILDPKAGDRPDANSRWASADL